jgi:tripartite-type tricarboxylate transporter receptor subunit TctC
MRALIPFLLYISSTLVLAGDAGPRAPIQTVTLVTHSSPGGGSDVLLREIVKHLARIMNVDFVVRNVKGGSGARAVAHVATADPNGTTLYATTPTYINMSLLSQPRFGFEDLDPLVNIAFDPQVLYARADSPHSSLAQVIAAGRSGARRQRWGIGNPASIDRQIVRSLADMTDLDMVVASHDGGGELLLNVLNGSVEFGIGELQELQGNLQAGKIKLLATFSHQRLPQTPAVATAREQGVDIEVAKFRGLAGPRGLPEAVTAKWDAAIPALLSVPEFQDFLKRNGLVPGFIPHGEYGAFVDRFVQQQRAAILDR